MLRVTFIHLSSFMVETDNKTMIFDFLPAQALPEASLHGTLPIISAGKKLYFFASSAMRDAFSPDIFETGEKYPDTGYVLSKDIKPEVKYYIQKNPEFKARQKSITYVSPHSEYSAGDIKVKTLRSTQSGAAFIIEADGIRIFYAGSLNQYNAGDNGAVFYDKLSSNYEKEIRTIGAKHIDLAFVNLDPRLGEEGYAAGMEYFVNHVDADLIFPMHCWEQFDVIEKFRHRPDVSRFADRIVDIDRDNLIFNIED